MTHRIYQNLLTITRSCGERKQPPSSSLIDKSPGSVYGYGTLLVRARPASYTGENILPVEIVAVRGTRDHHTGESRKSKNLREEEEKMKTKVEEPKYHSDKHFSNHFLNSNPKLDEMLTRIEK